MIAGFMWELECQLWDRCLNGLAVTLFLRFFTPAASAFCTGKRVGTAWTSTLLADKRGQDFQQVFS